VSNPVVWVRYDADVVRAFALDRLRFSDFVDSVPWRRGRARLDRAHYSGAYASATTGGLVVYERLLAGGGTDQVGAEHTGASDILITDRPLPPGSATRGPSHAAGCGLV
jgi:hypothetical protein